MLNILLVSRDKTSMSAFKAGLEENDAQTARADSGSYALSMIAERHQNDNCAKADGQLRGGKLTFD